MPSESPTRVTGSGGGGTVSIGGQSLGCITDDLTDDGQLSFQSYQTLCDEVGGYEQGSPTTLSRTISTTVEFLTDGAGIAAAENALKNRTLTTCTRVFSGQTSGSDSKTYNGYVTGVRKSVASGQPTGKVQINFKVTSDAGAA